jgi:hypothetical protein
LGSRAQRFRADHYLAQNVSGTRAIEQPEVWKLGFPLVSHPGIPI